MFTTLSLDASQSRRDCVIGLLCVATVLSTSLNVSLLTTSLLCRSLLSIEIMKLSLLGCLIAVAARSVATTAASIDTFTPPRVTYQELLNFQKGDDTSTKLFSIVEEIGLFSITDIPLFAREKPETLGALPACVDALLSTGVTDVAAAAAQHAFADGTIRKTIATSSQESDSATWNTMKTLQECQQLQESSGAFRDTVAEVTRTVGNVLSSLLDAPAPLLMDSNGVDSYSLEEIVTHGDHLEHFHVYSKPQQLRATQAEKAKANTIDWHTDQGLLLVFSPGMVQGQPSQNDFHIQLVNGQAVAVTFDVQDELVVMLGDGVHQYINKAGKSSHSVKQLTLRSVPHALQMASTTTTNGQEETRVWYGRMVLPPSTAVHPVHHQTFGQLRRDLIAKSPTDHGLGCSSAVINHPERQLQDITEDSCSPDTQSFCWHRCMNYTETVSPDACVAADASHEVACINAERELWGGDHNPDFSLGCINVALASVQTTSAPAAENDTATTATDNGNNTMAEDHDDTDESSGVSNANSVISGVHYMAVASVAIGWMFLA